MKKQIAAALFFVLIGLAGTVSAGDGIGVRAGLFGIDIINVNLDLPSSSGCMQSHSVYYVTSPDPSISISTSPRPASPAKEESKSINVVNSTNVNITVQESKSATVQPSKPVVIYYPSQRPSYYYYRPFGW